MKKVLQVAALSLVFLLAGCQTAGDAETHLRKSVAYSLTTYAVVWQPALITYSGLPYCDKVPSGPCKDRGLYKKLYEADAAVASCVPGAIQAVQSKGLDLSGVPACLQTIESAKAAIATAGVKK